MSDFSAEIKRWNSVAAGYDRKRANLRPISFDFTSKAYSNRGNYNGASTFNSARAKLMSDDAIMRSRMTYTPPAAAGTTPTHASVLKPSTDVVKAASQLDTTEKKIKELGGNAFRSAVGGLVRVADLISRTGYAIRSSSMTYAKENAAGGTTVAEHAQNALAPIFDIATMAPRVAVNAATGRSDDTYHAMWEGFSGRQKTSGQDLLKVAFPEFTSDHKKWTSVLSFGVDVVYDPLSWVTVGQGTVVSGTAKGLAAGGAAAVGKKAIARNLLANTVWTKTGRAGGVEALRADLYTRAAKPYIKSATKAEKALDKATGKYVKAASSAAKGGSVGKEISAFTRVEKARQVKEAADATHAAKLAEIQSQSFTGMQLAWKAVARKSLGLSSAQAFGKGVNTAGTAGRAAKEFKALQDLTHTEILDRFKSAKSPESHAWRAAHQDIIDSGNTTISYGKGKTFTVPEDYDDFVDAFGDIAFPKTDVTAVTKKDLGMRRGTLRAKEAESKNFFNSFNQHVDLVSKRGSKDLISPYRGKGGPRQGMKAAEAVKEMEQTLEGLKGGKERLLKARPNETDAMYQTRLFDEAATAAEARHADLVEQARAAQEISGDATEALRAADEALASAKTLRAASDAQRATADADYAEILRQTDEWLQEQGLSIGSTEDQIIAALSAQDGPTAVMDQINGHGLGTVLTRDTISANTQSKVDLINQAMNANVGRVVESAGGTMEGSKITKLPGMMDDAKNTGKGLSPDYTRQVNYEIAKAIQEIHEAARSMLAADALTNDYELAWDAIQQNTNTILNSLFGDTHVQVFTYLNEKGYSVLADTPHTETLVQHVMSLLGDTFTPMGDVLKADTLKADVRMKGSKGKYEVPPATMDKLRKQVPASLQKTHERAMSVFKDFRWGRATLNYNALVRVEGGISRAIDSLVSDAVEKIVRSEARGTRLLPSEPTIRLSGSSELVSPAQVFMDWAQSALPILRQTHTANTPSIGHYTLYDYWTFSPSVAKETQPFTTTAARRRGAPDTAAIGRAGYLGTTSKMKATLEQSGIVNEALDTIPAMDERMVELTSHVRGWLAGSDESPVTKFPELLVELRDTVANLLVPDLQKMASGDNYETVKIMEAISSLGAHVHLLSDTTTDIDTAAQVALASQVWGRSTKIRQLNESIMMFNLHNTLVEALGAEKAAERIVEIIKNRPNVEGLMRQANIEGTTNGTAGLKAPPAQDIGHIENQAKAAAEAAAAAWDAANPVKASAAAPTRVVGTTPVAKKVDEFVSKNSEAIANMPVEIADKFETLTDAHAPKFMGSLEAKNHKVYALGTSGLAVVRGPKDAKGGVRLYITRAEKVRDQIQNGFDDSAFQMRVRSADIEAEGNDVYIDEWVSQVQEVRKGKGSAPAVEDTGRAAARQKVYDDALAAKRAELKPAVVTEAADVAARRAVLVGELSSKKQAVINAGQKQAADSTMVADAAKKQQEALQVKQSADAGLESAEEAVAKAQAVDANTTAATQTPDRQWNQPGGFFTPELTDAAVAEIDNMIADLYERIDLAKINESLEYAQATMNQGMADYAQMMKEIASNYDINTRYMLKFAGIPIMPVATAHSPMAAYAGMVGMKESQGAVSNWLRQKEWAKNINIKFRRPSSMHDDTLEQMRLSVANNAQNTMYINHHAITATYAAYKNKAVLSADVKAFWTKGVDIPEGLTSFADRLLAVQNELFARTIRAAKITVEDMDLWDDPTRRAYRAASQEQVRVINEVIPGRYRIPVDILTGESRFNRYSTEGEPWSREWLIALSEHLERVHPSHPLASSNIGRGNNRLSSFDDAMQQALSRMTQETMMNDAMFDAFSFAYDAEHIKVLNATLPPSQQYVPLSSVIPASPIYGDLSSRYVPKDFGAEMARVIRYYQDINTGKGSSLNFNTLGAINNHWKAMVTAWNIPRYHIGNMMSDGFLNMVDGVGIQSYDKATQVMKDSYVKFRGDAQDPETAALFTRPENLSGTVDDPTVAEKAASLSAQRPGKIVSSIRVNGKHVNITSEEYYKAYTDFGLAQNQITGNLESNLGGTPYRKMMDTVMDWSSAREDYFRIAHFVHAVENEALIPGRTQQEIYKAARDRVVKYHFDYGDISEVERLSVGRFMPFYKWVRNIVPLSMSMLVTNPKAYIINNAANKAMGEAMYPTQEDANGNTIPVSYWTPSWVGQQNSVPIGHYTDPNGNEQARYAVLNLPMDQALANWVMPFVDPYMDPSMSFGKQTEEAVKGVLTSAVGSAAPQFKAAIQASTGKTPAQGGETYASSGMDWLFDPVASMLPFVPQMKQLHKDNKKGVVNGAWVADNFGGVIRETAATEKGTLGEITMNKKRMDSQLKNEATLWMARNFPDTPADSKEGKKILHDFYVERGVVSK